VNLALHSPWRNVSYRLRSLDGEVERRGRATGSRVRFRLPSVSPGLYVLSARAGSGGPGKTAQAPVVVRDGRRAPLLLVQPAIAWQGENPVDDDGDGFPDVLSDDPSGTPLRLRVNRPLAYGRLPGGFRANEAAITDFVASARAAADDRLDVTTDFALSLAPRAWLRGRRAVVLTGDARWLSPAAGVALRRFVERGGSVVLFSLDALRRTVRVAPGTITGPSPRAERDVFGERAKVARYAPAPVVPFADPFAAFAGPVGLFTRFDESQGRAQGAILQLSAGRVQANPAVEVYRLGEGQVVRVGVAGWGAYLARGDGGVAQATRTLIEEALR
jgi:hypothetical protein